MQDESLAGAKYEALRPDRARQLAETREKLAARVSDGRLLREWRREAALAAEHLEAADYLDPVGGLLDSTAAELAALLLADHPDPFERDPRRLIVRALDDEDFIGSTEIFEDGSALALISDAVFSLLTYLATVSSLTSPLGRLSRWGGLPLLMRLARRGLRSDDANLIASSVLIRHYLQHQRLNAIAGKIAVVQSRREADAADGLAVFATAFVVGHELAHFTLGHQAHESATGTSAHDNSDWELAADRLAVSTILELERDHVPAEARSSLAAFGTYIAVAAMEISEVALFVRRPHTHPPAPERWARIRRLLSDHEQGCAALGALDVLIDPLETALRTAADLAEPLPAQWWCQMVRHPLVSLDGQSSADADDLRALDALGAMSWEEAGETLVQAHGSGMLPRLPLPRRAGSVTELLREWGIEADQIQLLTDLDRPLSFHALCRVMQNSEIVRDARSDKRDVSRFFLGAVAARAFEPWLRVDAEWAS